MKRPSRQIPGNRWGATGERDAPGGVWGEPQRELKGARRQSREGERGRSGTRITTLLHDTQYRTALAWQNTAYNQPPHPSFFLGTNMPTAPRPSVYTP
ncbi:hypothetical protein [Streptomyces sp. NPDC049744]|uniref:rhamnogalacturonan lyase family protein n=1 Tax=Streptomyces sp. NPDC049744 TaxID=3154359 RepID=UPI00341E5249